MSYSLNQANTTTNFHSHFYNIGHSLSISNIFLLFKQQGNKTKFKLMMDDKYYADQHSENESA